MTWDSLLLKSTPPERIGQRDGPGRCQPLVSDTMKTISLRTLVREPLKVKRMTRAGQSVQVTDNGEPL